MKFKYKFQLVGDGKYGSLNPTTGEWDGIFRELMDQVEISCLKTLITQWLKHFLSVVKKPTHHNYFWLNDTLAKLRMVSKYDLSICIKSNAPSPPKNIILSDELELLLLKIDWVFRL